MVIGIIAGSSGHIAPLAHRLSAHGNEIAVLAVRPGDDAVLSSGLDVQLCSTMEEFLEGIDAALILEDRRSGADHLDLSRPALEAGIPTFVDKPLMPGLAAAQELLQLAERHGAPVMTCSAARYAAPIPALRELRRRGSLTSLALTGPGELWFYGVHLAEMAVAVFGTGCRAVHSIADEFGCTARLLYPNGTTVTLTVESDTATKEGFSLVARGPNQFEAWTLTEFGPWYDLLVQDILTMAESRVPPIHPEDSIEVLRILDAVERSAATSSPTTITDG